MYIVVTNKNPNVVLPKWIEDAKAEVLNTKILWKFRTDVEAAEAANILHDSGFEYVHRTSSY